VPAALTLLLLAVATANGETGGPAPSPRAHAAAGGTTAGKLAGVRREYIVRLPLAGNARVLPGGRTVRIDVGLPVESLQAALRDLGNDLRVEFDASTAETRADVSVRAGELALLTTVRGGTWEVRFGPLGEEAMLRRLAWAARRPLPDPPDLGSHLELWQEAQARTSAGELNDARILWEKLAGVPELRDLALLRVADLFVVSGHVREALSRYAALSREHPRTPGGGLARIAALHLGILTGTEPAAHEQLLLAASSVTSQTYQSFAWHRAAEAMDAMDRPDLGLAALPRFVPGDAIDASLRARLLGRTIGLAHARGDARTIAATATGFAAEIAAHEAHDLLEELAAAAYLALGLGEPASKLLRSRLRQPRDPAEEARIVFGLARAAALDGNLSRWAEIVAFAAKHHSRHPEAIRAVRDCVVATHGRQGPAAALDLLERLRPAFGEPDGRRAMAALEVDLRLAAHSPAPLLQALRRLEREGFDVPDVRRRQLALAWAQAGHHAVAATALRAEIGRTADPEVRDELGYALATAELALGHGPDADRILEVLAGHGTRWGSIARVLRRERSLQAITQALDATPAPAAGTSAEDT
jgi:hypothetical protein